MTSRVRLLLVGGLVLLLGAILLVWRPTSSAVLYSGYARADSGLLALEIQVTPPVGLPGDLLQLDVRLANHGAQAYSPSIILTLPRGISADVFALPSGATFNLQENKIDWLPVVPPGSETGFTLALTVQAADVLAPEQSIHAVVRHQGHEREVSAPLWLGIAPLVGDVQAEGQASVGQPVRLKAEVAGPGPIKTIWDLGDGRRLELANPEVAFPATGQYEISVEASNPGGRVARSFTLNVLPNPVAAFRPDDDQPAIGQPVTFINASGGQPPLRVFWDFGDGVTLLGEQQPTHTYRQGGVYRVRLTVENEFGRSQAMWDVAVGDVPIADLILPDRAAVGQPLDGQAFGDPTVVRYLWDMGDGRQHEGATVRHYYRLPGEYYVTLTAENGHGATQTGRWVHVDNGTSTLFLPLAAFQATTEAFDLGVDAPAPTELDPAVSDLAERFILDLMPFPSGATPAEQLLAYVNSARARFNLPPLVYNFELSNAAQAHTADKARFPDNPHTGSDGTIAAERLLRAGYRGGYAGEATAWGFADPREAVEFWVNSDPHRPLILNRLATDLGVGYVEDYATKNVWHWTAEFGVSYGSPTRAVLRAQLPMNGSEALDTDIINYSWVWPLPLGAGERFSVYLRTGSREIPLGSITEPVFGSRYMLSADVQSATSSLPVGTSPLTYQWFVRLEDNSGGVIAESESRIMTVIPDPNAVIATAVPTLAVVTATPSGFAPTITPTQPAPPTPEPPAGEQPPVLITATPAPPFTPEPQPQP